MVGPSDLFSIIFVRLFHRFLQKKRGILGDGLLTFKEGHPWSRSLELLELLVTSAAWSQVSVVFWVTQRTGWRSAKGSCRDCNLIYFDAICFSRIAHSWYSCAPSLFGWVGFVSNFLVFTAVGMQNVEAFRQRASDRLSLQEFEVEPCESADFSKQLGGFGLVWLIFLVVY